jgi:hypothetical protein
VPDPRSLRLVTLAGLLILAALGLWLLDAEWPAITAVMAGTWTLAAVVEWVTWRQERSERGLARREVRAKEPQETVSSAKPMAAGASVLQPPAAEEPSIEPEPPGPAPLQAPDEQPVRPPLRPVRPAPQQPPPQPSVPPAAARAVAPAGVVDLRRRVTATSRRWNLWDLERLARDELQLDPRRFQELSYLFVHLRQFATPDGTLPTEFDPLVRESLGDLLEQRR